MSQPFETGFTCGDGGALVTYLYGESPAAEREAIAAHVARCTACAEELAALGTTRVQLTAWAPPERALGFQIPRTESVTETSSAAQTATVLRPARWWNRPMPAWAQAAAAVVIFASGMAIGAARNTTTTATVASTSAPATTPVAQPASVTRDELAQIEQRLMGEIAQLRTSAPQATVDSQAVMQRVAQMIAASESRQQKELDFRTSVLATDLANARRIDNANIEQRLRGTNVRVLNNQQTINSLAQQVGYTPAYSPYVP